MLQRVRLTAGFVLSFFIPFGLKADHNAVAKHTLGTITIASTSAMDPMPARPRPYLRLVHWLSPVTDASVIYRHIDLKPGTTFHQEALLRIKKKLIALPYFSTVSVTSKATHSPNGTSISDILIRTKDRFPITIGLNLDEGALLTITHNHAWGYGHILSNQLFLKKRWGYGLAYEIPKLHGSYLIGGQYYRQIGPQNTYTFDYQNLWFGKLFVIQTAAELSPYYWISAVSGYHKQFITRPTVTAIENRSYHHYQFVLAKLGFVVDRYEKIGGVYTLHAWESLPKGGSVEMLYGYQKGEFKHRQYIGLNCMKNIANVSLRYLHLGCESGVFIHKNTLEEGILKLALEYAGPSMHSAYQGIRPFIHLNYIAGYHMPKERMLGVRQRDPEALEKPDDYDLYAINKPIHARLNVAMDSTLHAPILVKHMRFAFLGFSSFIALYDRNNALLNATLVNDYGIGLRLAYTAIQWPTVELKMAYSPLLGKIVPSVRLFVGHFKNATAPKPTLVHYNS